MGETREAKTADRKACKSVTYRFRSRVREHWKHRAIEYVVSSSREAGKASRTRSQVQITEKNGVVTEGLGDSGCSAAEKIQPREHDAKDQKSLSPTR